MRQPLKLAWFAVLLGYVLVAVALCIACAFGQNTMSVLLAVSLALGAPGFVVLTVRIARFRQKLVCFVRQFLGGNYGAGVRSSLKVHDEVTAVEDLVNKLADQVRSYDALRADKVAASTRALDAVLRGVPCPIVSVDPRKRALSLNPPALRLLGTEQVTYPLAALASQPENARLMQAVEEVREQHRVPEGTEIAIRLPGHDVAREFTAKLEAVKGREEAVDMILIFLS